MRGSRAAFAVATLLLASPAAAATLKAGVVPSTQKVRPADDPATVAQASIKAARNEFEAFQIVLHAVGGDVNAVSARVETPLTGPGGAAIPVANVVLYAERYYNVKVASNDEGAAGLWPDPLVPDTDTYFGEKRNAFPVNIPSGESRAVWVDVLVPVGQAPGDYAGAIALDVGGVKDSSIAVALHVGSFSLPSTATLTSAFGMGWNTPPLVHCGGAYPYCGGNEDASNAIRALYLRAALEHRVTISDTDFQPPFGGSLAPFETHVLPLIGGTAATRLPGAKLTAVRLDGSDATLAAWITYAKAKGFFDRLFYYPIDEPGSNAAQWSKFASEADALHAADASAEICLTSTIQDAQANSADQKIDIFVPVVDQMWGRAGSGYDGDQRAKYDAWLAAKANRKLWMYQSCDQHGCGGCGTPSPGVDYTGWPQRVIDSSGVQDRAFEWIAWKEKVGGELYFETTYQLATAWDDNGQCEFSGSGDGTIFYPGKPSIVGGTKDIPIESIRLKLIREGMEDYEYLVLVEKKDAALAKSVVDGLFPTAFDCAKSPAELEAARDRLFAALDTVPAADAGPTSDAGGGGDAGFPPDGACNCSDAGATGGDGGGTDKGGAAGSCGCVGAGPGGLALFFLALGGPLLRLRRRRR
jgi:hypothetical protein